MFMVELESNSFIDVENITWFNVNSSNKEVTFTIKGDNVNTFKAKGVYAKNMLNGLTAVNGSGLPLESLIE